MKALTWTQWVLWALLACYLAYFLPMWPALGALLIAYGIVAVVSARNLLDRRAENETLHKACYDVVEASRREIAEAKAEVELYRPKT